MRNFLKAVGNAALVVAGFFVLLFASSKFSNHGNSGSMVSSDLGGGVAHADAPIIPDTNCGGGGGDSGAGSSSDSGAGCGGK